MHDQTTDINGADLYRLSKLYKLPPFVKNAVSTDIMGTDEPMTRSCYAHPVQRAYPCHTPAATWLSTLFFLEKRSEWQQKDAEHIDQSLSDFAKYHGIEDRIIKLREDFSKKAEAPKIHPDDYAIIIDGDGYYPLRNDMEVKAAADWLSKYRMNMPYNMRQKIAEKILTKAASYGADISKQQEFLEKQAGYGVCSAKVAANLLRERAILTKRAGFKDVSVQLDTMADTSLLNVNKIHERDMLIKLAAILDEVDKDTGLRDLATDLAPAEDTLFELSVKKAAATSRAHLSSPSGNIYRLDDITKAAITPFREQFGDSFVDAISREGLFVDAGKVAELVPTLPRGDAEMFDRILNSAGIHPIAKEAAWDKAGFSTDDLITIAELYRE